MVMNWELPDTEVQKEPKDEKVKRLSKLSLDEKIEYIGYLWGDNRIRLSKNKAKALVGDDEFDLLIGKGVLEFPSNYPDFIKLESLYKYFLISNICSILNSHIESVAFVALQVPAEDTVIVQKIEEPVEKTQHRGVAPESIEVLELPKQDVPQIKPKEKEIGFYRFIGTGDKKKTAEYFDTSIVDRILENEKNVKYKDERSAISILAKRPEYFLIKLKEKIEEEGLLSYIRDLNKEGFNGETIVDLRLPCVFDNRREHLSSQKELLEDTFIDLINIENPFTPDSNEYKAVKRFKSYMGICANLSWD